jgi:hypothetical protein
MPYVYGHYKADDGKLFYIGKGNGRRAWRNDSRNRHWQNIVNKHGLVVKIIEDNLTDEEAFEKERQLIAEVGVKNLANAVSGGAGLTSKFASKRNNEMVKDPEWKRLHQEGCQRRSQDPTWKRKLTKGMKKLARNPEWIKKMTEINRKKAADPKFREKLSNSAKLYFENKER